jgi:site-specific DNA-methyltransferase (adenine-specific)
MYGGEGVMPNQIIQGDCLKVMAGLEDNSVDAVVTDPPYYKVKSLSDDEFNWWDHQWKDPKKFLEWIDKLAAQWQRILKPNGSLYCFVSPRMAARVEVQLTERFNVLNHIRWQKEEGWHKKADKEISRQFHSPWEGVIFCEHYGADNIAKGEAGYGAKCDELRGFVFEPLRAYLDGERQRAGLTPDGVNRICGFREKGGMAGRHWFNASQFAMPTKASYEKVQAACPGHFRREYEDLRREYEDLRRPFTVSADVPYTDVWTFPTVQSYPGKHPCEKPAAMLEHIITASSRPGAVVLDCFAGSGSTLAAAKKLGRQYIGIEIDPHWCDVARGRLGQVQEFVTLEQRTAWLETHAPAIARTAPPPQLSIFDIA